jgi:branched-subunit amino acid aminotransferase/4-amino-4-deoxychorismate lyase
VWPAIVDGRPSADVSVLIDVRDEGLLRGDGVYEVVRVYGRRPFVLPEHLARLERSCEHLRLQPDLGPLEQEICHVIEASPEGTFDLRVVITRGGRRIVLTEPLRHNGRHAAPGVRHVLTDSRPRRRQVVVVCGEHAGNAPRPGARVRRGAARVAGGVVLEAPTSSFFWVGDDGRLRTPPLSEHILDSITRRIVIELVGAVEERCTIGKARTAKELFLTSTTREVQPVKELDGVRLEAPGPVTGSAIEAFRPHVWRS